MIDVQQLRFEAIAQVISDDLYESYCKLYNVQLLLLKEPFTSEHVEELDALWRDAFTNWPVEERLDILSQNINLDLPINKRIISNVLGACNELVTLLLQVNDLMYVRDVQYELPPHTRWIVDIIQHQQH